MEIVIINEEDIPEDIEPGQYSTRIVSATWERIEIEYIGSKEDPKNPTCLIPIIKE